MTRIIFACVASGLLASTAVAQPRGACGDRTQMVAHLASRYGEIRTGAGLGANNMLVEVFASPDTGSWTILATLPDGRSCMVAAGQHWTDAPLDNKTDQPA